MADDHGCLPKVPTLLPRPLGRLGMNTSGSSQSRLGHPTPRCPSLPRAAAAILAQDEHQ